MGKVYFWLFPNLNEDLGVIESFKPFYSLKKRKVKKPKKIKQSADSDDGTKTETKAEVTAETVAAEEGTEATDINVANDT